MEFSFFYCVFEFFVTRGLHCAKNKKNACSEVRFFALKFSTFWAFFQHVSTCLTLVLVSWNFEMLQLQTFPTKCCAFVLVSQNFDVSRHFIVLSKVNYLDPLEVFLGQISASFPVLCIPFGAIQLSNLIVVEILNFLLELKLFKVINDNELGLVLRPQSQWCLMTKQVPAMIS